MFEQISFIQKKKEDRMSYSLMEIATQITRWTVPLVLILGILANFLNIIILRRCNMKHHSCTLYFITLSINNLIYTSICITSNLLFDGFGIDLTTYSNVFCKLDTYLLNFCPHILLYMLVLASIDRYCSSSLNIQRRRFSNVRIAKWSILIALIFTALFMLENAISVNLINNGFFQCTINTNSILVQILNSLQIIVYVIIAPFLMILFGLLTIHNTNQFRRNHLIAFRYRPNERQLTRMLIVQVSTHILLSLPFSVLFFMLIIPISFKSTIMFYFLFVIFKIPFYIAFITPFFLYILSARLYRHEFILLLKKICRIHRNGIIHPMRT